MLGRYSCGTLAGGDGSHSFSRAHTIGSRHVLMGHEAYAPGSDNTRYHPVRLELAYKLSRRDAKRRHIEDHDIGPDMRGIDPDIRQFSKCLRQKTGIGMIFFKTGRRFKEGDETCRGQDTSLPHAAT